jgi:hypothetical protein
MNQDQLRDYIQNNSVWCADGVCRVKGNLDIPSNQLIIDGLSWKDMFDPFTKMFKNKINSIEERLARLEVAAFPLNLSMLPPMHKENIMQLYTSSTNFLNNQINDVQYKNEIQLIRQKNLPQVPDEMKTNFNIANPHFQKVVIFAA